MSSPLEVKDAPVNLENNAFKNSQEKQHLEEWVNSNTNFTLILKDRGYIIEKLKGNILHENGDDLRDLKGHNIYLPHDLKIKEIPKVIQEINTLTFGDDLPDYASLKEIEKYIKLYKNHFPQCEMGFLTEFENEINKGDIQKCTSQSEYGKNIKQKESEDPENNLGKIEEKFSYMLENKLYESFQENGMKNIENHAEVFTKSDWDNLPYQTIETEETIYNKDREDFYDESITLTEVLQIDSMESELNEIRKNGNERAIEKKELEIIKKIHQEVHKFPWQDDIRGTEGIEGTSPQKLLEDKRRACVGKSMIIGSFLNDLEIPYTVMRGDGHVAILAKNRYFIDATLKTDIDNINIAAAESIGEYKVIKIYFENVKKYGHFTFNAERPEIAFMEAQILNQSASDMHDATQANVETTKRIEILTNTISKLNKRIEGGTKNANLHTNLGLGYFKIAVIQQFYNNDPQEALKNFSQARVMLEKSIQLSPEDVKTLDVLGDTLHYLGKHFIEKNIEKGIENLITASKAYESAIKYNYSNSLRFLLAGDQIDKHTLENKKTVDILLGKNYSTLGYKYNNKDFLQKAITYCDKGIWTINHQLNMEKNSIKLLSQKSEIYYNAGLIHWSLTNKKEGNNYIKLSLKNIEKAIKIDPKNPENYYIKGNIFTSLSENERKGGNDRKAQKYLDQATEILKEWGTKVQEKEKHEETMRYIEKLRIKR